MEGRLTVFAVRRPDGSEAVVKWSSQPRTVLGEWAALGLIEEAALDPPVTPRLLGGDVDAALVVTERLAPAPSLAGLLLGSDADVARRGTVALARAVGRLHGATLGRAGDFEVRRSGLSPSPSVRYHQLRRLPELPARLQRWMAAMAMTVPGGVAADVERVRAAMATPGPFLAVVHGDACPDNNRIYGDRAVLIDFQVAGIGHCLLDAAFFAVPFPSCWCVGAWEPPDAGAALDAYRAELVKVLPAAGSDGVWLPALADATAYWFLLRVLTDVLPALHGDEVWGTASMVQRLVQRAGRFADLARRAGVHSGLADVADQVVAALRRRWPGVVAMPAYPALARPGQPVVHRPPWWVPAP